MEHATPESSPYVRVQPPFSETYRREIARRRWLSRQQEERRQARRQRVSRLAERLKRIRRLHPGGVAASSLSPVYTMFNESFLSGRSRDPGSRN